MKHKMTKLFYISVDYIPKGQIEGYLLEVVDRMIHEQVKQGNEADVEVFEEYKQSNYAEGGFDWDLTEDSYLFWANILHLCEDPDFKPFKQKYAGAHITQEEFDEVNSYDASANLSELPEVHVQENYENGTRITTIKHPNGVIEKVTEKLDSKDYARQAEKAKKEAVKSLKKAEKTEKRVREKSKDYIKEAFRKEREDRYKKYDREHYDFINPDHYKTFEKEVWEMMVDIYGLEKFVAYCEMCAFKYRMRLGSKPDQPIERDLKKAKWYEDKARELKTNDE